MSTALDALPLSPFQQALERGGGEGYEEAVASSPAKCSRIATFRNSQIKFGLKSLHLFSAVQGGFLQNFEGIKVQTPTGKEEYVCLPEISSSYLLLLFLFPPV